jgi:type IV secretory pathway VirB4 component
MARRRREHKRSHWLERAGWYEFVDDPISISTRQAEALNPALVSTHPPLAGPPLGYDVMTGQPITLSAHEAYLQKRISSPNVLILGAVGSGKSSLMKTQYVSRAVALGVQVVVFDRKRQEDRGEYYLTSRAVGGQTIRFDRSGGAVVNILDPQIAPVTSKVGSDQRVGQDELLRMVAEHAHGPLDSYESKALREAHSTALARAAAENRVPVLTDVVAALFDPDVKGINRALIDGEVVDKKRLTEWGLALAFDLESLINGHLSGLISGPTQSADGGELDLSSPLLVVDTSALAEDSPALSLVMAVMATYLSSIWSATPGQRIIDIEEGYHTVNLPGVARVFRALAKRGRGIGLSMTIAMHHVSDVPDDSDANALIREAGIVHVYKQDKSDDAETCVKLFNLPVDILEELMTLDEGQHVLKVGSEPPRFVAHVRTAREEAMTDTEAGMAGVSSITDAPFDDLEDAGDPVGAL